MIFPAINLHLYEGLHSHGVPNSWMVDLMKNLIKIDDLQWKIQKSSNMVIKQSDAFTQKKIIKENKVMVSHKVTRQIIGFSIPGTEHLKGFPWLFIVEL